MLYEYTKEYRLQKQAGGLGSLLPLLSRLGKAAPAAERAVEGVVGGVRIPASLRDAILSRGQTIAKSPMKMLGELGQNPILSERGSMAYKPYTPGYGNNVLPPSGININKVPGVGNILSETGSTVVNPARPLKPVVPNFPQTPKPKSPFGGNLILGNPENMKKY